MFALRLHSVGLVHTWPNRSNPFQVLNQGLRTLQVGGQHWSFLTAGHRFHSNGSGRNTTFWRTALALSHTHPAANKAMFGNCTAVINRWPAEPSKNVILIFFFCIRVSGHEGVKFSLRPLLFSACSVSYMTVHFFTRIPEVLMTNGYKINTSFFFTARPVHKMSIWQ